MSSKFLRMLFILPLVLAFPSSAETVAITEGDGDRPFDGWGTSICWWGNIIGGYSEKNRDSIVSLVFDTAQGLGLNIIRYNIGGGDAPGHNHMGAGKEMEGFWDGADREFDWERDENQRRIVSAAAERIHPGHFIAEAFSNSPPYWMTASGCASGASNSGQNLKSDSYGRFAHYLTEVVKHFRDEWGVTFTTLEPFNEPAADWWNVNGGQEGCSFSRTNQAAMLKELHTRLRDKGLETRIAASDEAGYDDAVATYNSFDEETQSLIYQINTHGYSGSKRAELRKLTDRDGKKLWASEIDGSGAPAPFDKWKHDHNDIAPGLDIANRIIRDIRDLRPDGWIFWQVVESEQAQISLDKNWGCIHADFTGGEKFHVCKKFHALRQFTRFIRPGSTMVGCSNGDAVAFVSADGERLVIVQRNAAAEAVSNTYVIESGIVPEPEAPVTVWRTSADEDFVRLEEIHPSGDEFSSSLKARSITTFVVPLKRTTSLGTARRNFTQSAPVHFFIGPGGDPVIRNGTGRVLQVGLFTLKGARVTETAAPPGITRFGGLRHGAGSILILRIGNFPCRHVGHVRHVRHVRHHREE